MLRFAIVCLLAGLLSAFAASPLSSRDDRVLQLLMRLQVLETERREVLRAIDRTLDSGAVQMSQLRPALLRAQPFAWKNCGGSAIVLHNLTVTPNPIPLPGNVGYGLKLEFKEDVGAGSEKVKLALEIKKRVGNEFIKIPCIGQLGSCSWGNACLFDPLPNPCPHNFPCHCPFKKGIYTMPFTRGRLDPGSGIPSWITSGDYTVQATLSTGSRQLGCIFIQLSLTKGH